MNPHFNPLPLRRVQTAAAGTLAAMLPGCRSGSNDVAEADANQGEWVNDVHCQLNATRVSSVQYPTDRNELAQLLRAASEQRRPVSVCGGRHAAGGQQFLANHTLIDTRQLNRVIRLDMDNGLIEVESGIRWPTLIQQMHVMQMARIGSTRWAIHQKQGGADALSVGGAVGSNVHGRCLDSRPIVQDIDALTILEPDGSLLTCSRSENAERFRHIVGGYGLFGLVYSVTLQLVRRQKLVKRVRWETTENAVPMLEKMAAAGAVHGDFQYAVDETAGSFLGEGLLSWYEPTDSDAPVFEQTSEQAKAEFLQLLTAAHRDKTQALAAYRQATLATDGRVKWSDTWQSGDYVPNYHDLMNIPDKQGSELLTEIYVPRPALAEYMMSAAQWLRERQADLIYANTRLIRRDDETRLAWAKQDYACIIYNIHTRRAPDDIEHNRQTLRGLLDRAIERDGSYYLTYDRYPRKDQVLRCYPQLPKVLEMKQRFDPSGTLESNWYRYYRGMFEV